MSQYLIIVLVIIPIWFIGYIFHRKSRKSLLKNLRILAVEKNGIIKNGVLFSLPKLYFTHDGKEVEVSSASTGSSAESKQYTYVLISGLDFKGFEFRILPKSLQTMIDDKIGIKKQISTGNTLFDRYFSVCSSDKNKLLKILNDDIKSDLLKWAEKKPVNNISDIRNYDNKLIFCVIGELKNQYEFNELIKSAFLFYDSYKACFPL